MHACFSQSAIPNPSLRAGENDERSLVPPLLTDAPVPAAPKRSAETDDRGFALVSVLVVAASIALLALGLMGLVRELATATASLRDEAENKAALEAGLNRIILAFTRTDDPLRAQLIPDGRPVSWASDGKELTLRVQAESGKLDLNAADREHIAAVVHRFLEEVDARAQFLARLDAMRAAGKPIVAVAQMLSPFDRMTDARDRAESYFTVLTNQRGVDPATAPTVVLDTMPRISDATRRAILAARAERQHPSALAIPSAEMRLFVSEKPVYTFKAETGPGFLRAGAMRAVVGFSSRNEMAIYAWGPAGPDH
jgi:type II secretory pathway component PulK